MSRYLFIKPQVKTGSNLNYSKLEGFQKKSLRTGLTLVRCFRNFPSSSKKILQTLHSEFLQLDEMNWKKRGCPEAFLYSGTRGKNEFNAARASRYLRIFPQAPPPCVQYMSLPGEAEWSFRVRTSACQGLPYKTKAQVCNRGLTQERYR